MKMLPKQVKVSTNRSEVMAKRRIFNRTLDKVAAKFRGFTTINPDGIIPTDEAMFTTNKVDCLSHTGWHQFWTQVDDLIRRNSMGNLAITYIKQITEDFKYYHN